MHNGVAKVAFRKMMFNGARQNFGDLHVTGTVTSNGTHLHGDWYIEIRDPNGKTLVVFGESVPPGLTVILPVTACVAPLPTVKANDPFPPIVSFPITFSVRLVLNARPEPKIVDVEFAAAPESHVTLFVMLSVPVDQLNSDGTPLTLIPPTVSVPEFCKLSSEPGVL